MIDVTRRAMLATSSHSPIIEFPERRSESYFEVVSQLEAVQSEVERFDPDLVVVFGVDHYGGHHMDSMPSFCVGVEATAIADVGGTPGPLDVPRDIAVGAIDHLRRGGVDVAVSYSMDVDHGFTQALVRLTGGIDRYPVLPVFVSCIQPPFVPFARARALGTSIAGYLRTLGSERVLVIGTGGLGHNPRSLFPPIDEVEPRWKPYHLFGKAQSAVSQQEWIDFEIEAHKVAAVFLADDSIPDEVFGLNDEWDASFMADFCAGDMSKFDSWIPELVVERAGIGAMEVLSWVAAGAAVSDLTGTRPVHRLQRVCREIGIGFGVTTSGPSPIR